MDTIDSSRLVSCAAIFGVETSGRTSANELEPVVGILGVVIGFIRANSCNLVDTLILG